MSGQAAEQGKSARPKARVLADDAQVMAALGAPGWLVLIYGAPWCAPCGPLADDLAAVCAERGLALGKVDIDACPVAGQRALQLAGQRGVPLIGVYNHGHPHAWLMGAQGRPALARWLAGLLG